MCSNDINQDVGVLTNGVGELVIGELTCRRSDWVPYANGFSFDCAPMKALEAEFRHLDRHFLAHSSQNFT